jgi:hypothetical protein
MSTYAAGVELADKLAAAMPEDIVVTVDPRSATPPCVLITPPILAFDSGCGATATWAVFCLTPGTANADSWQALDDMLAVLNAELPIERSEHVGYQLSPDAPPVPAYRVEFTAGVDI